MDFLYFSPRSHTSRLPPINRPYKLHQSGVSNSVGGGADGGALPPPPDDSELDVEVVVELDPPPPPLDDVGVTVAAAGCWLSPPPPPPPMLLMPIPATNMKPLNPHWYASSGSIAISQGRFSLMQSTSSPL